MATLAMRTVAPRRCSALVTTTIVAAAALFGAQGPTLAAVTAVGDVTPAPPAAGGNVAAPFRVGNTGVGTLGITLGTPLTVTGGNAIIGENATGVGIVQLTGLGSNLITSTAGADLIIGNDGTGSLSAAQLARITIADDMFLGVASSASGDLFVDGLGTVVDLNDTGVIGGAGNALVQITAGGRIDADDVVIGQSAGGDGRITVSGNGSTLTQSNSLTIGEAGRGELQVIGQGIVQTTNTIVGNLASGTGVAVVSGAGSIWKITGSLNLGVNGMATLNVLDGGLLSTTNVVRMATVAGSESHAVVSGVNALLQVGTTALPSTVTVGEFGYGTLDIRSSAHVNSGNAIIGDNVGSRGEVLVDGVGSTWKITGTLDVSDPGEAQLAVTGGGQVTTTGVVRIAAAGRLLMGTGRLEAGGTGLTNNGIIQGTGRITGNVVNNATGKIRLGVGNAMIMANTLTNSGHVDLDGSELETLGALANNADIDAQNATLRTGATGLDNNSGAQLAITSGTVDVYGAVDNNVGAQIVVGNKSTAVFHDPLVNNGEFFVFPEASVLALEELTFAPTSLLSLQFGLADDDEPAPVTIESASQAALAGALAVTLAPGFSPTLGDAYQILTAAGGVSGTFATTMLPMLASGLAWDVDYNPNSVLLSVVAGLTADFDGDGDVDAMDLSKWKAGAGKATGAVKMDGDADGDGDVDGGDFLAWQQQLGSQSATGAAAAVPEPASGALGACVLAMVGSLRRGRRERPVAA